MAVNVHGLEGLIYADSTELTEANAFSIGAASDYAEIVRLGSSAKERLKGAYDVTGSLTLWHDQDTKTIQALAIGSTESTLLIYPKRSDLTTYYSLTCWFDFEHGSDIGSGQAITCPFFGDGALTMTGFS